MPFNKSKRIKLIKRGLIGLLISLAYMSLLAKFYSPDIWVEALLLFPLFMLILLVVLVNEGLGHVDKGIAGEDQVEEFLKEQGIEYERNREGENRKFDYDFIVTFKGKKYLLEVKNYEKFFGGQIEHILSWTKHNAANLKEELKVDWVNAILISILDVIPEYQRSDEVMTFSEFKERFSK